MGDAAVVSAYACCPAVGAAVRMNQGLSGAETQLSCSWSCMKQLARLCEIGHVGTSMAQRMLEGSAAETACTVLCVARLGPTRPRLPPSLWPAVQGLQHLPDSPLLKHSPTALLCWSSLTTACSAFSRLITRYPATSSCHLRDMTC